jgi:hypothetical protein
MTIGGVKVTESQFKILSRIQEKGRVAENTVNRRTSSSLITLGFVEPFIPDATNYAMAARGRVRYYRLTLAGVAAVEGLKKLYPQAESVK